MVAAAVEATPCRDHRRLNRPNRSRTAVRDAADVGDDYDYGGGGGGDAVVDDRPPG